LEKTVSVALRTLVFVVLLRKVTLTVQLAPGSTVPQPVLFVNMLASVPLMPVPLTVRFPLPVLATVTCCVTLAYRPTLPNSTVAGLTPILGAPEGAASWFTEKVCPAIVSVSFRAAPPLALTV
jgi:hypothetical protein